MSSGNQVLTQPQMTPEQNDKRKEYGVEVTVWGQAVSKPGYVRDDSASQRTASHLECLEYKRLIEIGVIQLQEAEIHASWLKERRDKCKNRQGLYETQLWEAQPTLQELSFPTALSHLGVSSLCVSPQIGFSACFLLARVL